MMDDSLSPASAYRCSLSVQVFTGDIPFNNKTSAAAIHEISSGKRPPRPTHPALTTDLWGLMERCWSQEPCSRPEVSEVLNVLRAA